jgi:hypothetical protein
VKPQLSVTSRPNPVGRFAAIEWQVGRAGRLRVTLYDATGRFLRVLHRDAIGGDSSFVLDARDFAAGIYLVRLETDVGCATRKLVLR